MHKIDTAALRPVFPQRLDWPSLIGLFIINFGALEQTLSDILMRRTKPESRNAVAKKLFYEKIRCLKLLAGQHPSMMEEKEQWDALIVRIDDIRDLRNHICHSKLVHKLAEDMTEIRQELCLIQDVNADLPKAPKVTFEDLMHQNQLLSDALDGLLELEHECGGAYQPFEGTHPVDGKWTLVQSNTQRPVDA